MEWFFCTRCDAWLGSFPHFFDHLRPLKSDAHADFDQRTRLVERGKMFDKSLGKQATAAHESMLVAGLLWM